LESSALPTKSQLSAERARRSLREYIKQAWPIVEPNTPFIPNWHIDAIADHLEACSSGKIRNLIINIPPRHGKSLLVSVFWPTWVWATNPGSRWIFASYAASLSTRDSIKCRRLIESPWYQQNFGHIYKLSGDQNLKMRFENNKEGYRIATSVGGSITGEGGDYLVVDDPHNIKEMGSDIIREGVLEWWDSVMSTRGNNPKTVSKVLIMQRVHEKDLTGHLLARGGWDHLCLPAEYEQTTKKTSIGFSDLRTKESELLWPDRFSRLEIEDLKRDLGSYGTSGQLQQRPTPAEGGIFKKAWIRYYKPSYFENAVFLDNKIIYPSDGVKFATVDLAVSTKESADYTVMAIWSCVDGKLMLLDLFRARMEGPDIIPTLKKFTNKYDLSFVGIESTGFQLSIVQQARKEGIPVKELTPDRDKQSRAFAATPFMESGNFWIPEMSTFNDFYIHELMLFPNGEHDDMVDATTYACEIARSMKPNLSKLKDTEQNKKDPFEDVFSGDPVTDTYTNRLSNELSEW